MVIVIINVVLSRYMTPISIVVLKQEEEEDKNDTGYDDHEKDMQPPPTHNDNWLNTMADKKKDDDIDTHEQHISNDNQRRPGKIRNAKPVDVVVFQKYLNLNSSHELWKDIELGFLTRVNTDNPTAAQYLFRLIWRWCLLNVVVFGVLHFALRVIKS